MLEIRLDWKVEVVKTKTWPNFDEKKNGQIAACGGFGLSVIAH